MAGTLTRLEAEPPAVGAIELLQGLLKRVKKGEISSLAFALVLRDGSGEQEWTFAPSPLALIGSVGCLENRLIAEQFDGD